MVSQIIGGAACCQFYFCNTKYSKIMSYSSSAGCEPWPSGGLSPNHILFVIVPMQHLPVTFVLQVFRSKWPHSFDHVGFSIFIPKYYPPNAASLVFSPAGSAIHLCKHALLEPRTHTPSLSGAESPSNSESW